MASEPVKKLQFQDVRIPVRWGHLAGRWYGNRQVRPILAIHGWMDNMGTWDKLLPLLPAHLGVLCIDLPGHGRSSWYPKGIIYDLLGYTNIVISVMKEYDWDKVSLMGHSMGAAISFLYAAIYPQNVDLVVAIDLLIPPFRPDNYLIARYKHNIEKSLIEDERVDQLGMQEPPSYTYAQFEQVLHKGSDRSVNIENCKYILNRNIQRSNKFPEKYYFSRDAKAKFYMEYHTSHDIMLGLAKRIRNVPYIVVKASTTWYINSDADEVIAVMRANNPFELHEITGTHHVHLNNAEAVAAVLVPFINHHRPPLLESWTMDEQEEEIPARSQSHYQGKGTERWRKRKSKL